MTNPNYECSNLLGFKQDFYIHILLTIFVFLQGIFYTLIVLEKRLFHFAIRILPLIQPIDIGIVIVSELPGKYLRCNMNRTKIKKEIKQLKGELKAANRKTASRLIKLAFVVAILALVAIFIQKPDSIKVISSRITSYFHSAETSNW